MTFVEIIKKEIIIMKKYFTLLFLMAISSFVFGQTMSEEEAKKPLQKGEIIIDRFGGQRRDIELNGRSYGIYQTSKSGVIHAAYNYAKDKYPNKNVFLRNMIIEDYHYSGDRHVYCVSGVDICEKLSGDYIIKTHLNKAFDKALVNVREGSRFSIDNVTVSGDITSEINKESVKDNVIDVLLDKGYKVVAKEYLERLYQEQQVQQSGIYNENTVVQENNLSAVGYFLNIKITDESLRVQVVNVSTGEYEGNATITF